MKLQKNGKDVLSLVEDIIPGILKLKMEDTLKGQWEEIREENSITCEYIPISPTEFSVKCKIVENNQTIFAIETYAGSRKKAQQIADNWNQNAQDLYPKLLALLDQ